MLIPQALQGWLLPAMAVLGVAIVAGLGFWFAQRTHDYRRDYNQSLAAYEQGNLPLALKLMQQAYQGQPAHVDTVYNLATLLLEDNQPNQALPLFKQALGLNPSDANIYFNLAVCYVLSNKVGAALDELETGMALLEEQGEEIDADWYHLLASAHSKLEQRPEALAALKQALAHTPYHTPANLLMGTLYLGQHLYNKALPCFEAVMQAEAPPDDDQASATFYSAYCQLGLGQWEAVTLALQPAALPPLWQAKAYNLVGLARWHLAELAPALDAFEQAIALQPTYLSPQWHGALACLALGQHEAGLALLETALNHPELAPHEKDEWLLQWQAVQQQLFLQPLTPEGEVVEEAPLPTPNNTPVLYAPATDA